MDNRNTQYVEGQLASGRNSAQIVQTLVDNGWQPKEANQLVAEVYRLGHQVSTAQEKQIDAAIKKGHKVPLSKYTMPVFMAIPGIYLLYITVRTFSVSVADSFGFSGGLSFIETSFASVLVSYAALGLLLLFTSFRLFKLTYRSLVFATGMYAIYFLLSFAPAAVIVVRVLGSLVSSGGFVELLKEPTFIMPLLLGISLAYAWLVDLSSYTKD